jgi:hypothetical protein
MSLCLFNEGTIRSTLSQLYCYATLRLRTVVKIFMQASTERVWLGQGPVKALFLLLLLMLIGAARAQDFSYTNINGTTTITGYRGSGGAVTIPGMLNGLQVTSIGDWAFYGAGSIKSVSIPESITSVGNYAFYQCTGLTNVTIPNSITNMGVYALASCSSLTNVRIGNSVGNIGYYTFLNSSSLTSVTIPNSVTGIGDLAFWGCESLTNIALGSSVTSLGNNVFAACYSLTAILVDALNPVYRSVDGVLFDKNVQMLVTYPPGKAGSYAIPSGVTNVAPSAFSSCDSTTNLTLPASMTRIGAEAFAGFLGLSHIAIPDTVITIGTNAFLSCVELASLTIGNGVTNLEDSAFEACTNLRAVYFKGNAPHLANAVFDLGYTVAVVYYLPGTTGWGQTFGGQPTLLWNPQMLTNDPGFGVRQNRFGFNIAGTADIPLVVEASTNLAAQSWVPLQSLTLTSGTAYFSDSQWTNFPDRFYRIRSP